MGVRRRAEAYSQLDHPSGQARRREEVVQRGAARESGAGGLAAWRGAHHGAKRGASKDELAKDDWTIDKSFDGQKNRKPKGVVYIVDGAGGNRLYNNELNKERAKWKPFQAEYMAEYSFSIVSVKGKTFSLRQIDNTGKEIDRIEIKK